MNADGQMLYAEKIVLISTYWNVNFDLVCSPAIVVLVLISTYWNVNTAKVSRLSRFS